MPNKDQFIVERTLLDVTVSAMAAGTTVESPTTGSKNVGNTTIAVTPNTITSTALQRSQVADALHVYVIPPRAADGTFPDVEIWFRADNVDLHEFQLFNVQADALMCPVPHVVVGGPTDDAGKPKAFTLGRSARSALWDGANGKAMPNMAMLITGIKYANQLTVMVRSIAGWANTAPVPLRIIVTGEILDEATVQAIAGGYNPVVNLQHLQRQLQGRPALKFSHDIGGALTFANWTSLPGGAKQRGHEIHRFARWGTNAVDTASSAAFPLTNQSDLRGGATNVGPASGNADSDHDLGFNSAKDGSAFWLRGFGVRVDPTAATAPNWGYAGWQIEGDIIPSENGNTGLVARTHVNPFQFGSVQPQRTESGLYTLIPRYPGELLINGEGAVPIVAANGTAVAAGVLTVAIDGTYVKKS